MCVSDKCLWSIKNHSHEFNAEKAKLRMEEKQTFEVREQLTEEKNP